MGKAKDNLWCAMPSAVLARFFAGGEKGFWASVGSTLLRTLICFVNSFAIAMLLAVLGGIFTPLHRVISPIVSLCCSAPTVAVILVFYAFMSSNQGDSGWIFGAFPIMYCLVLFGDSRR